MNKGTPYSPGYLPHYDLFLSNYILDETGRQYPTQAILYFRGGWEHGDFKNDRLSMHVRFTSEDGIHYQSIPESGSGTGTYQYNESDGWHGNVTCHFGEDGVFQYQVNGTMTLNPEAHTFQANLNLDEGTGTVEHYLTPWQCTYTCDSSIGGDRNETCDDLFKVSGNVQFGGELNYTADAPLQLRAQDPIISPANKDGWFDDVFFHIGELPGDQLWRISLPPYTGSGYGHENEVEGSGSYGASWSGKKSSYIENYEEISTFYPDGTYEASAISDHHQRQTAQVQVDNTKPIVSEPVFKSLPDGRAQVIFNVRDPLVNGVRAGVGPDVAEINGISLGKMENGEFYNDYVEYSHEVKLINDFTAQVIVTYKPPLTPSGETDSSTPSSPPYDPSSYPSGAPSSTPMPQPAPTPDPQIEDHNLIISMRFFDKVHNRTDYESSLEGPNLRLHVNEKYFSPNADGRKDSLPLQVEDIGESEDWTLEVRRQGTIVKTFMGHGTQDLTWDGRSDGGQVQPEGAYNLVLQSRQTSGFRNVVIRKQAWIDVTPPEYRNPKLKAENNTYKILVGISDRLSGVLADSAEVRFESNESISNSSSGYFEEITNNGLTYNTGSDSSVFDNIQSGQLRAHLILQDRAGNERNEPLELIQTIASIEWETGYEISIVEESPNEGFSTSAVSEPKEHDSRFIYFNKSGCSKINLSAFVDFTLTREQKPYNTGSKKTVRYTLRGPYNTGQSATEIFHKDISIYANEPVVVDKSGKRQPAKGSRNLHYFTWYGRQGQGRYDVPVKTGVYRGFITLLPGDKDPELQGFKKGPEQESVKVSAQRVLTPNIWKNADSYNNYENEIHVGRHLHEFKELDSSISLIDLLRIGNAIKANFPGIEVGKGRNNYIAPIQFPNCVVKEIFAAPDRNNLDLIRTIYPPKDEGLYWGVARQNKGGIF